MTFVNLAMTRKDDELKIERPDGSNFETPTWHRINYEVTFQIRSLVHSDPSEYFGNLLIMKLE